MAWLTLIGRETVFSTWYGRNRKSLLRPRDMLPPAPQSATTSKIRVLVGRAARARSGEAGWRGYIVAEGFGVLQGACMRDLKIPQIKCRKKFLIPQNLTYKGGPPRIFYKFFLSVSQPKSVSLSIELWKFFMMRWGENFSRWGEKFSRWGMKIFMKIFHKGYKGGPLDIKVFPYIIFIMYPTLSLKNSHTDP